MKHFLHEVRLSFRFIQALVVALLVAGAASRGAAQVGTNETVIQKATESTFPSSAKFSYIPSERMASWPRRK